MIIFFTIIIIIIIFIDIIIARCVYLNEYRIAVAAFTLHGEGKEGKVVTIIITIIIIIIIIILTITIIIVTMMIIIKVVRSWKEALEKANAQYQEAKLASACSFENILGIGR